MRRVVQHLRQNLVAYLALGVALGGTAYAADKIGSKQIKNDAVKERHIAPGAVGAADIAKGAVGDAAANESDFGVIRTPRVTIDDPAAAGETTKTLLTRGPFEISVGCTDGGATMAGITYKVHSDVLAYDESPDPDNPVEVVQPDSSRHIANNGATGTTAQIEGPETAALSISDDGGHFLSVSILAVRKPAGGPNDCAFIVTGFGR